jgi:hypothetical protein
MRDDWKVGGLNDIVLKKKELSGIDVFIPFEETLEDSSWLVGLARNEDEIERTGMISYEANEPVEKILKEGTIAFLNHMRALITKYASIFNAHRSEASSALKVYGINNTEADFMVFRNSLKLLYSMQRPGVIQISFNLHSGGFFTSSSVTPAGIAEQIGDVINAQLGPFNETVWVYQGRKINTPYMIKYHLTKFIQNSVK